jgi:hypothetical protein
LAQQKPGVQDSVYLLAVAGFMARQSLSVAENSLVSELGRRLYIGST